DVCSSDLVLDRVGAPLLPAAVRLHGRARLQRLDTAIRRAGRPEGVTLTMFVRREAGLVLLGVLFGVALSVQGLWVVGVPLALVLGAWMRVWLYTESARRRRQIDRKSTRLN